MESNKMRVAIAASAVLCLAACATPTLDQCARYEDALAAAQLALDIASNFGPPAEIARAQAALDAAARAKDRACPSAPGIGAP
jgi:outer membrane murein-binding lipoprotein Lpp